MLEEAPNQQEDLDFLHLNSSEELSSSRSSDLDLSENEQKKKQEHGPYENKYGSDEESTQMIQEFGDQSQSNGLLTLNGTSQKNKSCSTSPMRRQGIFLYRIPLSPSSHPLIDNLEPQFRFIEFLSTENFLKNTVEKEHLNFKPVRVEKKSNIY